LLGDPGAFGEEREELEESQGNPAKSRGGGGLPGSRSRVCAFQLQGSSRVCAFQLQGSSRVGAFSSSRVAPG
jgi:hypothetical protein